MRVVNLSVFVRSAWRGTSSHSGTGRFLSPFGLSRLAVLGMFVLLAAPVPVAAQSLRPAPQIAQQPPAPAAQSQPQAQQQANAITQVAAQQGMSSCIDRVQQVSNFLGFSPNTGAMFMTPPAQPNQRIIPLLMEVPTETGGAYVSASFAPNQVNGCGATYDAVVYWPLACDVVATRQFPTLPKLGIMKKDIAVLDGGQAIKVFLMPAGNGCVSIKKEVVF